MGIERVPRAVQDASPAALWGLVAAVALAIAAAGVLGAVLPASPAGPEPGVELGVVQVADLVG